MQFIQLPLLGALLSIAGKSANSVNGRARAIAKPSIPTTGARATPDVPTSTNRNPMMGPVHEKLTRLSVKAIRKMLSNPVVRSALLSTALDHDDGSESSKPPKKLKPNSSSSRQKNMLNGALVLKALSALAPNIIVTIQPKET